MTQTVTAFEDFRDFLAALRAQGELIEVDRPVAPELEVAKALRKSAAVGGPPPRLPAYDVRRGPRLAVDPRLPRRPVGPLAV